MAPQYKIAKEEKAVFVESEEWEAKLALLEASRPRCIVVLTKTFCCNQLLPIELEGDVLDRWVGASYFYTSGYCPECGPEASAAQWSLTHYDDAYIIWNGHGLEPHLDDDAETLLH